MKLHKTLMVIALSAMIFGGTLLAEERGRVREMRGTFVRLVEQQVNEQGYLGVVIKPFESNDHVTALVPRDNEDLRQAARQLREGQTLGIAFAGEGRNNWVTRIEAGPPRDRAAESPEGRRIIVRREEIRREPGEFVPRPEGERRPAERDVRRDPRQFQESPEARRDRAVRSAEERERERTRPAPGPEQMEAQIREIVARSAEQMGRAVREVLGAHIERMQAELRELRANAERMEREMQELRAQNERLRMQLRNRAEPGVERERQMREQPQPQREREIRERRELEQRQENREAEERELQRDRDQRREPAPSPQ